MHSDVVLVVEQIILVKTKNLYLKKFLFLNIFINSILDVSTI